MPPLVTTIQPTKNSIRRGSSGHYYSALPDQATALAYAIANDIIVSNPNKYQSFADAMVGASGNPNLVLGTYDKSIQGLTSASFPEYMYSHNPAAIVAANRIPVSFSAAYTQMQPDHTGAVYTDSRGFTSRSWAEQVSRDHWYTLTNFNAGSVHNPISTIYFDSMSAQDGSPMSWQDGHVYTAAEWHALVWAIGDYAKSIRPAGMWYGGNGLRNGSFYMGGSTDPTNPTGTGQNLPGHLDWVIAENYIRGNFDAATAWPTTASLEADINMTKSAAINKWMLWGIVNCQNFTASPGHAGITFSSAQADQWRRLSMAAFLIGNDGYAVYEFSENTKTKQGWQETHPYYSVILGLPIDNKANAAAYINATTGLYTRNFEQGTVYINNTGATVTFNPGTGYSQVGGGSISGTTTIAAHDGLILLHTPTPIGGGGGGGSTASKKPAMQGMIDRDGNDIPSSYRTHMGGMAYHVNWADLQSTNTTTLSGTGLAGIATLIANARSYQVGAKIRIFCGKWSPGWLMTSVGTFQYADAQDDKNPDGSYTPQAVPRFWMPAYTTAFDNLMKLLAAQYDTTDVVLDIAIANTMTKYAEPMQRFFNLPQNRSEMVGGGNGWSGSNITVASLGANAYSDAANIAAFKAGIDSAFTWWKNANISVAWNPYQTLFSQAEAGITYTGSNQVFDTNDDANLTKTKNLIDYCVAKFGDRFVKENNSVRDTFFTYDSQGRATGIAAPTGSYGLMYTYLKSLGPPQYYQTASTGPDNTNPVIGSLDKVCDGIINVLKGNAIEPPGDYTGRATDGQADSSMYGPTNFDKWNALAYANPLPTIGGSTGGGGGGTGGGGFTDQPLSTDTYTRTVVNGLGNSDSGLSYTTSGTIGDYDVDLTTGRAIINIPLTTSRRATLNGVSQQDFHVVGKFSWNEVPVGDDNDFYLFGRCTSDGQNGYRVHVDVSPSTGGITARLQKVVAGAVTSIGVTITDPNPFVINTTYSAELLVTGINPTTLQFMFYKDTDGRPSDYTTPLTDAEASLQGGTYTAGWSWYIRSLSTSAPATGYVTEFDVFTPVQVAVNNAPSIVSVNPPDGQTLQVPTGLTTLSQTVTLVATDVDGTVVSASLSINGGITQAMSLSGGQWSKLIVLPAGTYTILYTVTDDGGASTTLSTSLTIIPPVVVVPPPPVLGAIGGPVDVIDVVPKTEFAILHTRHDGTPLGEVQGTDVRFGRYVMQPGFISYDMHRSHPMATLANSEPNKVDFALLRGGVELMTGELIQRDADTDTDMVSIAGNDWMNYLDHLYLDFDPNNMKSSDNLTRMDTDLKDITEALVQKVLNQYNNTIDLAMNNQPTGLVQSQHFSASDMNSLKSMIDTLANQNPGFEWEITHDQQLILYSPKRLDQSIYRVDASNIKQVHFGEQGVQATTVYGRGQGAGSAQAISKAVAPGVAATYRDRVMIVDLGTVSTRKSLASLTKKQLTDLAKQKLEFWITIIPRPGENVYSMVYPGQYVNVDWDDGYMQVQGWFRCAGYEGFVNTAGDEQITFNFNTDSADV